MKRILTSLLFCFILVANAQEIQLVEEGVITIDSILLHKSTEIDQERTFSTDLKEKYKGKDFEYTEDKTVKQEEAPKKNSGSPLLGMFAFFMSTIFPFLLGGFVIFVILKSVLGIDARFWQKTNKAKVTSTQLIYEDEDINDMNLQGLLQQAIDRKEYRLAIRYYYLTTLKALSNKQFIDYHKDKTNSEYLFEIENTQTRTEFSYLSYVFSYVWYGEFTVDEQSFTIAQNKYQSFLKTLV